MLRRQQQTQRTALLIGKKPPQAMGWRYVLSGEADAVLIGSLSAGQLLQFPDEVCAAARQVHPICVYLLQSEKGGED